MRQNSLIVLAGVLTLAIAGCASEEAPPVATSPAPSPVAASPAPVASPTPPAGKPGTTQPLVAQRPAPAPPVSGLIPSTNAQEREKQVRTETKTGKSSDPFSALPPDLPKPTTTTTRPVPKVAQLPGNRPGGRNPAPTANPAAPGRPTTNAGAAGPEKEVPTPAIPTISEPLGVNLPPTRPTTGPGSLPSADTAQGVEVTGVVVVGGTPQAIIIAPGDGTSRYVSQGQRIAGGRVLVKRIDARGSEPVVILEENGVEVARSVGEKPPQPANAKPAA